MLKELQVHALEDEASERMQPIEPIIKEKVVAAARGSRPRISGTARAIRNLSEHNFGVPIADLAKNPQASQRKGKGRRPEGRGSRAKA